MSYPDVLLLRNLLLISQANFLGTEMYDWDRHIISEEASLLDALVQLNRLSGLTMVLFAVDADGRMTGTLTDGDIRRFLIGGRLENIPVREMMHRDFLRFEAGNIRVEQVRDIRARKIMLVPSLDSEGRICEVYDFSTCHSILPLDAVLMAGGRGERLRPMTLTTPKPLLKIGGKCIIDYNIEELARNGIENIAVTVNYLADQMEAHFAQPVGGVNVRCVREPKKLGTIGSLRLVDGLAHNDVLVMNSDLFTTISYEEMYLHHLEEQADLTVAAVPYMVSVPFAIFRHEGTRVLGLEEKPTYNYYANAGIYIVRRELLDRIPEDTVFDATDLMETLIAEGRKVSYFSIDGTWIDVGSPDDFRHAQDLVKNKI